jgi:hypothetical protein
MEYGNDSIELRSGGEGDPWIAMQSAYLEYRSASEALERTHQSTQDYSTDERLRMMLLEGRQRAAFERYVGARMEALELRVDAANLPESVAADVRVHAGGSPRTALLNSRSVIEVLAVVLLCTTAFSLSREVKHVRDLEASRDELRAKLQETRDGLRSVKQQLDAWARRAGGTMRIDQIQRRPAPRPRPAAPRASGHKSSPPEEWRHAPALNAQRKNTSGGRIETRTVEKSNRGSQAYIAGRDHSPVPVYPPAAAWPFHDR